MAINAVVISGSDPGAVPGASTIFTFALGGRLPKRESPSAKRNPMGAN